ncbi:hypothetical protein [Actinomadura terrae]|uniref:hypothetical protein n=1 Tax=Actinomadura terrae TaxID=604353 RepID=UPI001FA6C010|nr:hypothetical protein [Actinomadura terrae]
MTEVIQTITLNCGHVFAYALPVGQLSLPIIGCDFATCVDCFNRHSYEGFRTVVSVVNSDERPKPVAAEFAERADGALFGLAASNAPATDGGLFSVVAA